jgi:hypothetical protein
MKNRKGNNKKIIVNSRLKSIQNFTKEISNVLAGERKDDGGGLNIF